MAYGPSSGKDAGLLLEMDGTDESYEFLVGDADVSTSRDRGRIWGAVGRPSACADGHVVVSADHPGHRGRHAAYGVRKTRLQWLPAPQNGISPRSCDARQTWTTTGPRRIMGLAGLRLASAQLSGCDYFVTCDERLVRQGKRLKEQGVLAVEVINPVDLLREM